MGLQLRNTIYYFTQELIKAHHTRAHHTRDELGKGKNDCGNGGIIYGLFLAPKIKYCLVLNNDYMIEEKKTFKGYVNKTISIEDYVKFEAN